MMLDRRLIAGLALVAGASVLAVVHARPSVDDARDVAADHGRPAVTFAGFHVFGSGRSRIFVKLTGQVPVDSNPGDKKVDFVMRGARIVVKNNKNPLLTKHFVSSVMSARLVPSENAVTLSVALKDDVKPTHELKRHSDGSATLHVDFPKPSPKADAPDDDAKGNEKSAD